MLRFSGVLVADGTAVALWGAKTPVHLIADAVSRVGMRLQRLPEESEVAIRGQFQALLRWWGLTVAEVKVLISDGASWYRAALDWVLHKARQQRCLFHLWRNILPLIRAYGAQAGKEAARQFIAEVKAVWDAASLAAAQAAWLTLQVRWGSIGALQEVLALIERTLTEAMLPTEGVVEGMGRTSTGGLPGRLHEPRRLRPLQRHLGRIHQPGTLSSTPRAEEALLLPGTLFSRGGRSTYPGPLTWLDVLEV